MKNTYKKKGVKIREEKKSRMAWLLLLLPFLSGVVSCGGKGDSIERFRGTDEGESSEVAAVVEDPQEDTVSVTLSDTLQRLEEEDTEAIVEYMEGSSEARRYMAGVLPRIAESSREYAVKLIGNPHEGFIVVDKGRMKVILYDRYGIERKSYGMACAKHYGNKQKGGDSRTPEGFFSVEGVYDSTDWLFTDDEGHTSQKKGQYGPRFIRLSIPTTSHIGIHGTCAPWSIGGRSSHGCIRVKNENILELVDLVEPGMPVIVIPGKKDREVNRREGYESVWFATTRGGSGNASSSAATIEEILQQRDEEPAEESAVVGESPEEMETPEGETPEVEINELESGEGEGAGEEAHE